MEQEKLVLWRGDIVKINRFSMQKTDKKEALVGQGIYLTDEFKVAQSYRLKGKHTKQYANAESAITLFSSDSSKLSRDQLLEAGFEGFVAYKWQEFNPGQKMPGKHEKEWGALAKSLRLEWRTLVRENRIKTETIKGGLSLSTWSPRYKNIKYLCRVTMFVNKDMNLGYISKFVFDRKEFEDKILNIGVPIKDTRVLRILYDLKFLITEISREIYERRSKQGLVYSENERFVSFRDYCSEMQYAFISTGYNEKEYFRLEREVRGKRKLYFHENSSVIYPGEYSLSLTYFFSVNYASFIAKLKEIGYQGFEYSGGSSTRSSIKHRAFSIWNENFVNAHRVDYSH